MFRRSPFYLATLALALFTICSASAAPQHTLPKLRVSDNRRFLVGNSGKMFF